MEIGCFAMDAEGIVTKVDSGDVPDVRNENEVRVALFESDNFTISTQFLPICLYFENGEPQCFETIEIRGMKSRVLQRYSTFDAAAEGHDAIVRRLSDLSQ